MLSNMVSKKADVSINTIVYIAIAVLVLVLIVMYTTGMFGRFGGGVSRIAPQELQTIKDACTASCNNLKIAVDSSGASVWGNSDYCTRTNQFDKDGDGVKDLVKCWDEPVNIICKATVPLPAPEKKIEKRMEPKKDAEGNPILDAEGNPVIEEVEYEAGEYTVQTCSIFQEQGCTCIKQ